MCIIPHAAGNCNKKHVIYAKIRFVFVFFISDTVVFENRYEKLEEKIIDWLDNFDDEIKPKIINFWYKFWK